MNIENTKAQMRKGVLEFCILSLLAEQEAYPSDIIRQLKGAKLIVVEGTLYPLLTRLKNAGLLNYRWEESTSRIINGYSGWANLRLYEIAGNSFWNIDGEIICSSCPQREEENEEI